MPDFWPDELSDSPYADVGGHGKPSPYDDCGHLKCVVCKAEPGKHCVNPVTGKPRKLPCIGRIVRRAAPAEVLRKRWEKP